ncbi:MAG: ATP-binding protein [Bacteroidota bacterium]|nr:ATP-binding protein [Bacteroidota bacterium]
MKKVLEKLFPTLGKKIAASVIIVSLIVGGGFIFSAYLTGRSMLEKQAKEEAQHVAVILKGVLEFLMLENKCEKVHEAMQAAASTHYIPEIYILRTDGTIYLKSISNPGVQADSVFLQKLVNENKREHIVEENDKTFEYIVEPITNKPECSRCHGIDKSTLGFFAVKIGLDELNIVSKQHRTANIAMTILTFIGLSGIIFFTLTLLVIKPVNRLRTHISQIEQNMERLEKGEKVVFPTLPEPENNTDEIANLTRSFNHLITQLNYANSKLIELHHTQLEHADRLATTGEIAASIAHEIKNPIAGVLGALQIFEDGIADQDEKKEIYAEMIFQLERVNHAVNDLLSYARPAQPVFEEVQINDLLKKTMSLMNPQLKDKKIAFKNDFADDLFLVAADKKQMKQVFWNVLINALQSIDTNGKISIRTLNHNSSVQIVISDSGKGIDAKQLDKIFKAFYTTKHKGTGLGLTITKRIVEQHRGEINFESEPGIGTTVTINIPIVKS